MSNEAMPAATSVTELVQETLDYVVRITGEPSREGFLESDYAALGAEWGMFSDSDDDLRVLVVDEGSDTDEIEQLLARDPSVADYVNVVDPGEHLTEETWDECAALVR